MAANYQRAASYLAELLAAGTLDEWAARLRRKPGTSRMPISGGAAISADAVDERWRVLGAVPEVRREILDPHTASQAERYGRNIEHFVGTVKLPVGIAGPLRVNGVFAQGDYYVPLATSEAALVLSYSRGASVITEAGGASAMLVSEGVSRSPAFVFADFEETGRFVSWILTHTDDIRHAAESTTRFGKLVDLQVTIEGNHVYLLLLYTTGEAAGQNMVTIATDAAVKWITAYSPVKPRSAYVESNLSADKKASAQSLQSVRGKKVTAEVILPAEIVRRRLHTTAAEIDAFGRIAMMGGVLSGTVGVQGHYANGLTALFIACGQDAACVAEAAIGTTRFESTPAGDLYASVTLPNLIVGTVGGGTGLPSQRACLDLLQLPKPHGARALAEVAACLCLAGEISIVAAVSAGQFTEAHVRFARRKAGP
jgi:hydroxymethylglutaryl-CoA reductase (NADPH)